MKNNDKVKIDILSNIDDDIVERNSVKRFELIGKIFEKKPNRRVLIAWISVAACLFLIFGGALAVILGNLNQVPVYTGMTVSDRLEQSTATSKAEADVKTSDIERLAYELTRLRYTGGVLANNGNNGNAYGKNNNEKFTDTVAVESETD